MMAGGIGPGATAGTGPGGTMVPGILQAQDLCRRPFCAYQGITDAALYICEYLTTILTGTGGDGTGNAGGNTDTIGGERPGKSIVMIIIGMTAGMTDRTAGMSIETTEGTAGGTEWMTCGMIEGTAGMTAEVTEWNTGMTAEMTEGTAGGTAGMTGAVTVEDNGILYLYSGYWQAA